MATTKRPARRARGTGSLFQRTPDGPWVAAYHDGQRIRERSTRTTDRRIAEAILSEWLRHAARVREGLAKPVGGDELDRHAAAALDGHIAAFVQSRKAGGRAARHVADLQSVLTRTAEAIGWGTLGELNADELESFIAGKQAPAKKGARKWTPRTAGKVAGHWKAFARWCVASGRLAVDPLARVAPPAPIRQREARALLPAEWPWLRSATEAAPGTLRHDRTRASAALRRCNRERAAGW